MSVPHHRWSVENFDKHLAGFANAIQNGFVPRKDVPGRDYQQIDLLVIRERWGPIVDELRLEWDGDVAPNLNVGPHQLDGVVRIVRDQQHRPASSDEPAPKQRSKPELERIRPAARALYQPDGLAPDHVRTNEAIQAVNYELERRGLKASSDTSIKRVIGRAE